MINAEQMLLGMLMADNRTYLEAHDLNLSPGHFADPINGVLYDEIENIICDGECADAVTVLSRLLELGIWDRPTWVEYLVALLTPLCVGGPYEAGSFARQIIATATKKGC